MNFSFWIFSLIPLTLSLIACNESNESSQVAEAGVPLPLECASAKQIWKPGDTLSRFVWKKVSEEEIQLTDAESQSQIGRQLIREIRKSKDPLNASGVSYQKDCVRFFIENLNGTDRRYIDQAWTIGNQTLTAYKPQAGYAVIHSLGQSTKDATTTSLLKLETGERKLLASHPFQSCQPLSQVFPSPSGAKLILVQTRLNCTSQVQAQSNQITWLDSAGTSLASPQQFELIGIPYVEWQTEEDVNLFSSEGSVSQKLLVP